MNKKLLFKGDIVVSNQNLMSGSDVKKLKARVLAEYRALSAGDLDTLLSKIKEVGSVKLASKITLYTFQSNPLFFEQREVYPSLYALWRLPKPILPIVEIYPPVLKYLIGGADLMANGIVDQSAIPNGMNQLVQVHLENNFYPIAIGYILQNNYNSNTDPDKSGKIISIIHLIDDKLFNYGSGQLPADFQSKFLRETSTSAPKDGDSQINNEENTEKEQTTTTTTTTSTNDSSENSELEKSVDENDETTSSTAPSVEISQEEMDRLILKSFLGSIKFGIQDKDLPMVLKTVFNKYMLYYQDGDTEVEINMKKSSHKKLIVFLREMEKGRMVTIQEPSPGNFELVKINRKHPDYQSFELDGPVRGDIKEIKELELEESNVSAIHKAFGKTYADYVPLKKVNEVFLITKALVPLVEMAKDSHATLSQITTAISNYTKARELDKGSSIQLDSALVALMSPQFKFPLGSEVAKQDYYTKLRSVLKLKLELVREDDSVDYIPNQPIELVLKKAAGNKKVIEISNLELFSIPIKEMAQDGMKIFAASTTIQEKNGKEILKIQGNQTDRVIDHISKHYKIPSKYITLKK